MKSNVEKLVSQAISEGTVFNENILLLRKSPQSMETRLKLGDESVRVVIMAEDAGPDHSGSLLRYVGRTVPFVLTRMDGDIVYGSRALALDALKASMLQALSDGKPFTGTIVKLTAYGAYVEVNGVPGLLRNTNATADHSEIGEHLKEGDQVSVVCRDIDAQGRINWKLHGSLLRRSEPIELDFAEDTVIVGDISGITSFRNSAGVGVFVRVAKGVDALCAMPEFEVVRGQQVAVRILRILPDVNDPNGAPKVRGKILRLV